MSATEEARTQTGVRSWLSDPFARLVIVASIAVIATLLGAFIMFQLVQAGVSPMIISVMILGALVIVLFGEVLPTFIHNPETKKIARIGGGVLFIVFMLLAYVLFYSGYHTSIAQLEITSLSGALLIGAVIAAIIVVVAILVYEAHHRKSSAMRIARY